MNRRMLVLGLAAALIFPAAGAAQTYLLVVGGIGGEPTYRERFQVWCSALVSAARDQLGIADDRIVYLAEDPERDPRIDDRSTKANIEAAFADLAQRAEPSGRLVVVLVGHGSTTGNVPRFNLPGPDMQAEDFAAQLSQFATQEIVVVNLASASGDWVGALSGERRVIVTATRSAAERHETVFGGYFVAALTSEDADTDKDGRISLLEAFEYARREVARVYQRQNRLLTEHALLDDDGDGSGAHEPDPATGDGARARTWFLTEADVTAAQPETDDSVLATLYGDRARLEGALAELRARKDSMDAAAYEAELERLLLELARTNRSIREREARIPG